MNGVNSRTGKRLSGSDHLRQSVSDILSTPVGSRVLVRDYGSDLFSLVDNPRDDLTRLRIIAATASALARWEPGLRSRALSFLSRLTKRDVWWISKGLTKRTIFLSAPEAYRFMASSYDVINLSALAVPDAIVVPDAADIFTRWLARLRELDPEFDALVESDPAYKQGEINAYQLTLAFQRVNDAVRAVFLASARGADLDQLGAAFNVSRLVINPGDPDAVPPVDPGYEDDEAFRERIQLSWAQLNTAGARNAYRFHAKSADNDVLDADAYGPETHNRPGEVDVYVLANRQRRGRG